MADEADMAQNAEEIYRAAAIRRAVRVPVDPGAAGTCLDCREEMPRLVGGRCGYCRDGRTGK